MITHKAKDLKGNWVAGMYCDPSMNSLEKHLMVNNLSIASPAFWELSHTEINPDTLCPRVGSLNLFKGDIVVINISKISLARKPFEAFVDWREDPTLHYGWVVVDLKSKGVMELNPIFIASKVLGNIHDNSTN
jgi:hypothetical protein